MGKIMDSKNTINIFNCSRCGKKHIDLPFKLLDRDNPSLGAYAVCPDTQKPILIMF